MTRPLSLATKPRLPSAESILPYLCRIDQNRWYSNFGPLNGEFESRLERRFEAPAGSVVTIANATTGITLALRSFGLVSGFCLLPSWTFAASAIAVVNAGLTPYFVDVDPESWQITPEIALRSLHTVKDVRAVLVVAPFGAPVNLDAWARFAKATGISIVIDNAAGFDVAQTHPKLVSVVSLHATKVLGVGEGGFILAGTQSRADKLRRMSNFGFNSSRESIYQGANAKLSEYSAAVGLAALDRWDTSRQELIDRAAEYREQILGERLLDFIHLPDQHHASATFNVTLRQPRADHLISFLQSMGIGARKWWSNACHRHPSFRNYPRARLLATEDLVRRVVALPFWIDMTPQEMTRVVEGLVCFFSREQRAERTG
jgi:dTDP-4-amino-4,6-dideoxygalactose transaminase